jgi:hypothetical protein
VMMTFILTWMFQNNVMAHSHMFCMFLLSGFTCGVSFHMDRLADDVNVHIRCNSVRTCEHDSCLMSHNHATTIDTIQAKMESLD